MNAATCDPCQVNPSVKHVGQPRALWLCWSCFDEWRKWYFGVNYRYCIPLAQLQVFHEQLQPRLFEGG